MLDWSESLSGIAERERGLNLFLIETEGGTL